MARRATALIVALAIAALGTTMIIWYLQGVDARAADGREYVEVVTATEVIAPGESVRDALVADKLQTRKVVRNDLSGGALTSTASIKDLVALSTIYPGQQLIAEQFGQPGGEQVLGIPGERLAISVELTDPERVAGFVTPGSRVAIFVSGDPELYLKDGSTRKLPPLTRVLLPKVQVLGVGDTTVTPRTTKDDDGTETTEQVPRTILTIAVSQKEAERVIYGARNGDLTFALRTDKSRVVNGPGTTARELAPELFRGVS
ncbi:Flp pilus assembly protein CpaB [Nocardioides sp. LMS-CY]|uniref:Flp pilus assembly protein CpaB n=1 Tax=Nocardioides sp. (strain LMS-CY) TaxID=2840457 RepID=UPI001C00306A|nr:Flp pilus assembly protein CpaB [Nocardioides sp. LMS-CY]QWF24267.1 Flp pilus assembly protein CpaB [Nocardioides sp. LMS-CY]